MLSRRILNRLAWHGLRACPGCAPLAPRALRRLRLLLRPLRRYPPVTIHHQDHDVTLHAGHVLDVLPTLDAASVNCVVTSPPYFGLRDYGVDGQIGLEQSPAEYVAALVDVFREVRRVLRDDGVVWLNLGDSYARGNTGEGNVGGGLQGGTRPSFRHNKESVLPNRRIGGRPNKSLFMVPELVVMAFMDDGWTLRSKIVWRKPNAMPESVKDRPSNRWEPIYLLTKSERYWFDKTEAHGNVWDISTAPFPGAHFACFPPELPRRCIAAGCPPEGTVLDPFTGSGTTGMVARQLGRKFVGVDLNPAYLDIAIERIGDTPLDFGAAS